MTSNHVSRDSERTPHNLPLEMDIRDLTRQMEFIQEEIGLKTRLVEIARQRQQYFGLTSASKPSKNGKVRGQKKLAEKAEKEEKPAETEAPSVEVAKPPRIRKKYKVKVRTTPNDGSAGPIRGRPKTSVMIDDGGVPKRVDLFGLVEHIGKKSQNGLDIPAFVVQVRKAGYPSKAADFSKLVHNALVQLVKDGKFTKNRETRTYEYAA